MLLAVTSEGCCQHSPAGAPTAPSSAQLPSPTDLPFIPAPSTERKSVLKVSFSPMLYAGGKIFWCPDQSRARQNLALAQLQAVSWGKEGNNIPKAVKPLQWGDQGAPVPHWTDGKPRGGSV